MMDQDIEFRNAKYDQSGTITCEINHPKFGWIPFTASASDIEPHGVLIFESIVESGNVAPFDGGQP